MKKIISALITAVIAITICPFTVTAADTEEHVIFEGEAHADFQQWGDDWDAAIKLGNDQFDVRDFTEPFTIQVEYESAADPVLVMFSWTGGTEWVQMTPSYASHGIAYYKYDLISAEYGEDFSTLNGINIMPQPSEDGLTVQKVSYVYETSDNTEISLNYGGLSGEIITDINAGWNLGNSLDCYGDWITDYSSGNPSDFETAWGNPVAT